VSGDPGSGKSRLPLGRVAHVPGREPSPDVSAPDGYQEAFQTPCVAAAILVRLRDFWQHLPPDGVRSVGLRGLMQALERWVNEQTFPGVDGSCVTSHLEHGSALLMLDGVDEVPPVRKADGDDWFPRRCC